MAGKFVISGDIGWYDGQKMKEDRHNDLKEKWTMLQSSPDNASLPAIIPASTQHTHANGQHSNPPAVPFIRVNDRNLHEVADDAQRAVQETFADTLFLREGKLVHLTTNEHGRPRIAQLTVPALRDRMSQAARFVKVFFRGGDIELVAVHPPPGVPQVLLERNNWKLRPLRGITEIPILRPDGSILASPGYDVVTALLYAPAPGLHVPTIPEIPTPHQVQAAVDYLLNEVLIDFPFVDDGDGVSASRANALALLLTPIVRPLINDLAPVAVLDKPQQGTGAGLYTEVVSTIATGRPSSITSVPHTDEEWRKRITSLLLAGHNMIIIDNVEGPLHAPSLGAVLTARVWSDRRLGKSEIATFPHEATWMVTGNNIELRGDLPRRSYWIRMNAKTARPWQRQGFKHEQLLTWVTEHRGEILAHLLTLARAWVVAGKPFAPVPAIGNFNAWAKTIGGILAHAGVSGFLQNLRTLYEALDEVTTQWAIFLQAWHQTYGARPVFLSEVVSDLRSGQEAYQALRELLPDDLRDDLFAKSAKGVSRLQRRLGNAFKRLVDRYFEGDVHLEKAGGSHHAAKWRVVGREETRGDQDHDLDSPDSLHMRKSLQRKVFAETLYQQTDSPAAD
jgi:hypothetical protein